MATFEEYLGSIGAKQKNIGFSGRQGGGYNPTMGDWTTNRDLTQPGHLWSTPKGLTPYGDIRVPYDYGEQTTAGITPGYVDASGGFLGYGANQDQLTNPSLLRGYSDFIAQDPQRELDQLAATDERQRQLEASRAAHQEYLNNLPSVGAPAGSSQLTGTPQNFGGFGGAMPGFGAQQQQAQPGLLGGLHRGKFGGTGLLGDSGQ